jgi:hypothetical protein
VFLDGSMTTPVIYLNQSLSRANAAYAPKFAEKLKQRTKAALAAYLTILKSQRSAPPRTRVAVAHQHQLRSSS